MNPGTGDRIRAGGVHPPKGRNAAPALNNVYADARMIVNYKGTVSRDADISATVLGSVPGIGGNTNNHRYFLEKTME